MEFVINVNLLVIAAPPLGGGEGGGDIEIKISSSINSSQWLGKGLQQINVD